MICTGGGGGGKGGNRVFGQKAVEDRFLWIVQKRSYALHRRCISPHPIYSPYTPPLYSPYRYLSAEVDEYQKAEWHIGLKDLTHDPAFDKFLPTEDKGDVAFDPAFSLGMERDGRLLYLFSNILHPTPHALHLLLTLNTPFTVCSVRR